jgi:hypothetical protein
MSKEAIVTYSMLEAFNDKIIRQVHYKDALLLLYLKIKIILLMDNGGGFETHDPP